MTFLVRDQTSLVKLHDWKMKSQGEGIQIDPANERVFAKIEENSNEAMIVYFSMQMAVSERNGMMIMHYHRRGLFLYFMQQRKY